MKLALMGDLHRPPDEGMRKTAQELRRALEKRVDLFAFDIARFTDMKQWRALRAHRPDGLLYVPGPSLKSLGLLRLASAATSARVSAGLTLNPEGLSPRVLMKALRPTFLFFHSESTERRFAAMNIRGHQLPLGVDLAKFRPPTPEESAIARKELGVPEDRHVILHVGHLKEGRNLRALIPATKDHHVLIVASTATQADPRLRADLEAAGIQIIQRYLPRIEAVYHAVDAYAFPVEQENNCTEVPLSILEALASGLPVVTTGYGAVPALLSQEEAVLIRAPADFGPALDEVAMKDLRPSARVTATRFSWDALADQILSIYERELHD